MAAKINIVSQVMSNTDFSGNVNTKKQRHGFHLNLAFQSLEEIPQDIIRKHSCRTSSIDLSYNNFKELYSLADFQRLHTLILDSNAVHSYSVFPELENLRCLSLNGNYIENMSVFIPRLSEDLPKLKHLSMMKNDGAPSYFNGGSVRQNQDYRHFAVCHFSTLESLDGQVVTDDEKTDAYRVYGRRWRVRRRTGSRI